METLTIRDHKSEILVNLFRLLCLLWFPTLILLLEYHRINLIGSIIISLLPIIGLAYSYITFLKFDKLYLSVIQQRIFNLANKIAIFKIDEIDFIGYGLVEKLKIGVLTRRSVISYPETIRIQLKNGKCCDFFIKLTSNDILQIERTLNIKIKPIR